MERHAFVGGHSCSVRGSAEWIAPHAREFHWSLSLILKVNLTPHVCCLLCYMAPRHGRNYTPRSIKIFSGCLLFNRVTRTPHIDRVDCVFDTAHSRGSLILPTANFLSTSSHTRTTSHSLICEQQHYRICFTPISNCSEAEIHTCL
jgi:hypothetical protein